ncbi:MAG: cardiolipin synthase [Oscillospiraceae bacterium]|nr:cardiolipin synthase [Oscillospiraceae bacterium]
MKKLKQLCRIIFGRTMAVFIFLLIQILILYFAVVNLSSYFEAFYTVNTILSVAVMIYIISDDSNTSFKMAWIIPVLVLPVFGTLMYIYVKTELGTKLVKKKLSGIIKNSNRFLPQNENIVNDLGEIDEGERNFAVYMKEKAFFPVYGGTSTKYFPLGDDKLNAMLEELEKAEKFIFMEYFIVEEGEMWASILDILKRKAKQGVEVRFMYDGTCTIALLPVSYPKKMASYGIKCKVFSPIKPVLTTVQNNRDHRKILVIDGKVAFTGGVNLADEYVNKVERFGHWKDTAIMLKGDAVKSFTVMFLQNWSITEPKEEDYSKYIVTDFPELKNENTSGYVIPYSDSPLDHENVGQNVYLDILYRAKKYVHIMTPYLILDDEMITALTYAAKRGVETVIIMPHIPDKQYAYLLARTYYAELISAGVKIYEYTPGFVHAKVFVSDDIRAVVGSINLDYRSLFLHFECAAYTYGTSSVAETEADYLETLKKCTEITLEDCRRFSLIKRIIGKTLRIIAPLM